MGTTNACIGRAINGNVYQTVNNRNNTRSESFTYDSLNRMVSGQSSGTQWGEAYTIDAWSNLIGRAGITGQTNYEPLSTAGRWMHKDWGAGPPLHYHHSGCPTLAYFARVGMMLLALIRL